MSNQTLEEMQEELSKMNFEEEGGEEQENNDEGDQQEENPEGIKEEIPTEEQEKPEIDDEPGKEDDKIEKEKEVDTFDPFVEKEGEDEEEKAIDDEDGMTEEDARLIDSRTQKIIGPLQKTINELQMEKAINQFMEDPKNEVYISYREKIKEYALHPKSKGMSLEAVARLAVNPRELIRKGATLERQANNNAKSVATHGKPIAITPTKGSLPNAWDLSQEEFLQVTDRAMGIKR